MIVRLFSCLLACSMVAATYTDATATTKKKTKTYIKLVSAYSQKVTPGNEGNPPMTGTHFVIVWEGDKYPETFFWRGSNGWLSCKTQKTHKAKGAQYTYEDVGGDDIHKGDTLTLSPVTGGRFPIPAEIPTKAKNTLFFKTGGSAWLAFPVKKITKRS